MFFLCTWAKSNDFCCCSFSKSCPTNSLWTAAHQTPLFCPSLSPGISSNLCTLSQWCHPTISSNHICHSPSPLAFSLSQHQGLFQWVCFLHQVAKVLELQLQYQSFQWIFRTDFFYDWLVWSPCNPMDSKESSLAQFKSISSPVLSLLYGPTLTSVHDYWKNHSFDYLDLCRQSDVSAF